MAISSVALAVHDEGIFELDVRAGVDGDQDKPGDPIPPLVGDGNTIDEATPGDDWENIVEDYMDGTPAGDNSGAFAISIVGDTFANSPFGENNIGNASDPPGLKGELGAGTWVESKVSLERFRGRRLRIRYLETSLKLGTTENWEAAFQNNPDPGDDGWWLDNIEIDNTLITNATITKDAFAPPASTLCAVPCTGGGTPPQVTADLTADPVAGR